MIKNSVIIIPNISNEDQVCDFLWQTKKVLAKNNFVYIIDCSSSQSLVQVLRSLIFGKKINYLKPIDFLPFRRFVFIKDLNRAIYFSALQVYLSIKHRNFKDCYLWMFFPQLVTAVQLSLPWWQIIFDIVDFHTSENEQAEFILTKAKRKLLTKADHIFVISHTLLKQYEKFIKREHINLKNKIEIVPQGFDLDSFSANNKKTALILPDGKPIIGFIGQISERLDFKLIENLVLNNRQWNFVFIGPWHHEDNVPANPSYRDSFNKICQKKNCFYYEKQPRKAILSILDRFDICMIPYDSSFDFNRYSYPMKVFEYFYAGKPVVSAQIDELERFSDFVKMGADSERWQKNINQLLKESHRFKKQSVQREIAIQNSWLSKLERIYEFIKKRN